MAHPQIAALPLKISSYAKIAAMPVPNSQATSATARKDTKRSKNPPAESSTIINGHALTQAPATHLAPIGGVLPVSEAAITSIQHLSANSTHTRDSLVDHNADSADSYGEDQSQISSSSINKPQSFDTKSLASVTTFAMDDKESIRPDDSASVRAVDDDIPHASLSRDSSFQHDAEQLARPTRVFPSVITFPGRRFPTLANPPRFGNLPISPVLECQDVQMPEPMVQPISPDVLRESSTTVNTPPDEKLLEALASTKDRLPLLQLEEKLLSFLRIGQNDILDLPPQNSFNRLLTHKLADYYHLAHAVADDNASVRILKAAPQPLPIPLTEIARSIHIGVTPAPIATAVKIMRREQLAKRHFSGGHSTAPSSSGPSKATSETGLEGLLDDGLVSPAESTPGRDKSKMTREERETQYKIARDRIFADFQELTTSEATSNEENSASISRSSSSSGKKKAKKNKQPKDDSFEARSAYIASYAPLPAQYATAHTDLFASNVYPTSPTGFDHTMYGAMPAQSFSTYDPNTQYANTQAYSPAMPQQFGSNDWQAMQAMQMQHAYLNYPQAGQFSHPPNTTIPGMQAPQSSMSEWYPNHAGGYMAPGYSGTSSMYAQQSGAEQQSPISVDQYGADVQRPYFGPPSGNSHQGYQGSKSLFNPQTRSFVPNLSEGRSGHRSNRFKNQSRSSLTSNGHNHTQHIGALTAKEDSLKQKYGTPASLPKKPPPQGPRMQQEFIPAIPLHNTTSLGENSLLLANGVGQRA